MCIIAVSRVTCALGLRGLSACSHIDEMFQSNVSMVKLLDMNYRMLAIYFLVFTM